MGRNFLICLLMSLMFTFFLSCSNIRAMSLMAIGNYEYIRGDYQGAISTYYNLVDDKHSAAWGYYNLGIVYYSLGEYESSLRMFSYAKRDNDFFLNFNINYNEGIIYYNQGLYRKAEMAFKEALRINPASYNAKYNLELAIIKKRTIPDDLNNLSVNRSQNFIENNENFLRYIEGLERVLWVTSVEEKTVSSREDW
ncbi:Putative cytosolic protein [Borrelia hermsii YBT]|uniref:tetratricopeptide repeat protein n=1 Tax=Borrelia hermsii TaxID=140 RepID=UPI0003E34972|nr:tetratricopeptide repeat protein [Borrelia hermsii]AHH12185.1 Putative cytosolic protein [Borrelia hermsii YBT]